MPRSCLLSRPQSFLSPHVARGKTLFVRVRVFPFHFASDRSLPVHRVLCSLPYLLVLSTDLAERCTSSSPLSVLTFQEFRDSGFISRLKGPSSQSMNPLAQGALKVSDDIPTALICCYSISKTAKLLVYLFHDRYAARLPSLPDPFHHLLISTRIQGEELDQRLDE